MKYYFLLVLLVLTACSSGEQKGPEIFQKGGSAIGGYDPVAFFTENQPVKGDSRYQFQWKDATWLFSSQANLDSFRSSPDKFAPQYGGYCAYGMAEGHKAPTEVDTWTLVDGKLYFNYNQQVKESWSKDIPTYIEKANQNWEQIKFSQE
jgi:YHS domain-containing protein